MDGDQLNSPIVNSGETPDFGNSILDAFNKMSANEEAVASPVTEAELRPAKKESAPVQNKKTSAEPAKSRAEKDIELMFSSKQKQVEEAPAADPDSDIPETIKSTKAAEAFRKIKEEKAALAKQLDDLKKNATKTPTDDYEAKLKTLNEEREALSERLRLLDIERHPEFVKKYESRINGVFDSVKNLVGTDGDRLVSLLKAPESDYRNSQIDDIVDGLSPAKKAKLGALIVKHEEIQSERSAEINEAKSDYEAIRSRYQEEESVNTKTALEEANKTWSKVAENARALEIFEPRENDDEWNTELTQRMDLARQIFNGENSEEDLAKAALWAAAAPKYRELLYAQVEVNKRLQAELAKYRGAEPGVSSSSKGSSRPAGSSNANPNSQDFITNVMKSLGR
jgi:hypothetical protein